MGETKTQGGGAVEVNARAVPRLPDSNLKAAIVDVIGRWADDWELDDVTTIEAFGLANRIMSLVQLHRGEA